MVKVDLFDIVFVNKHNVFEAGQLLKGFLVVQLSQAIKVDDLRLKVKGKAQTQWSTHRGTLLTSVSDWSLFAHSKHGRYL